MNDLLNFTVFICFLWAATMTYNTFTLYNLMEKLAVSRFVRFLIVLVEFTSIIGFLIFFYDFPEDIFFSLLGFIFPVWFLFKSYRKIFWLKVEFLKWWILKHCCWTIGWCYSWSWWFSGWAFLFGFLKQLWTNGHVLEWVCCAFLIWLFCCILYFLGRMIVKISLDNGTVAFLVLFLFLGLTFLSKRFSPRFRNVYFFSDDSLGVLLLILLFFLMIYFLK